MRHGDDGLLRGYAVTHPSGDVRLPQNDRFDQLVHASTGVLRLSTPAGRWVLPADRAAWVPAGVEHRCRIVHRAAIRTLYLPVGLVRRPPHPAILAVSPLARELIVHAVERAPLPVDERRTTSLLDLLLPELDVVEEESLRLPQPTNEPARRAAELLAADPVTARSVDDVARSVGVSRRTLERSFRAETGLSIGQWRTRQRLLDAVERLSGGQPVGRIAQELGYATQAAFGAMFKAHLGSPPGEYRRRRASSSTNGRPTG
ncbi:MAG: helix-turn-helix transcriptional regulator [Actinomycetota bacterium]